MGRMHIVQLEIKPYAFSLTTGQRRQGAHLHVSDGSRGGVGDIAPLPNWSKETLQEALQQLENKKAAILNMPWESSSLFHQLQSLNLLPSLLFALESALLSVLDPLTECPPITSALLMGSVEEILSQARLREQEGYLFAKVKIGHLQFEEALPLLQHLKLKFHLRVDVNKAWETADALRFFSHFSKTDFDYVEEPFKHAEDLKFFTHPLAIDESFPHAMTLEKMREIPYLKALVYKPTIQGGAVALLPLIAFAKEHNIDIVLSSSFESDVGLNNIATLAQRFSLNAPLSLGTQHFCRDVQSNNLKLR